MGGLRIHHLVEKMAPNMLAKRGRQMDTDQAFSSLIGDIYDCTLDPGRWPWALGNVARFLGCERVSLTLNDLRRDRILIEESHGWEPGGLARRNLHLPEIHAVLQSWFGRGFAADTPFVASHEIPAQALLESPYYRDCLQPLGIVDIAHFFMIRSEASFSEIVLMRHASVGPFGAPELEAGKLLLPHLRRAVTISQVLDAKVIEHRHLAQSLDALQCAVVLTDDRGAIVHANRAGGELLSQGQWLVEDAGVIRARQLGADRELRQALRLSTGDAVRLGATGLAIRLSPHHCQPVHAHVLPLGTVPLRAQVQPQAAAAIFVGRMLDAREHVAAFAAACALTPAETRVVQALMSGHTLTEAARVLGVERSTAKTQLDSVFLKAGVARQSELIRVVLQSAAPVLPAAPSAGVLGMGDA